MATTDISLIVRTGSGEGNATKRSTRGIKTENRFVEAANTVFWERGFGNCTIAQIIDASGLSVGSFYHRFADKDELLQVSIKHILTDYASTMKELDLSAGANHDLFTMWYRLSLAGRKLVSRNRGIYRALSELTQHETSNFGELQTLGPTTAKMIYSEINAYLKPGDPHPSIAQVRQAVQLMTMCVLHTELGLGPMFPKSREAFSKLIARAACGVIGINIVPDALPHSRRPEHVL